MTKLEHAIKHIKTRADAWAVKEVTEALQSISERLDKALSQEPCEDAISREAVLDAVSEGCQELRGVYGRCEELINALPSVTQKSGEWINDKNDIPICSRCGYIPQFDRAIDDYEYSNYCPSCGAKMVEPQESEE